MLCVYIGSQMTRESSLRIFKWLGFALLIILCLSLYFSASEPPLPYKSKSYSTSQDLRLFTERLNAPLLHWKSKNGQPASLRNWAGKVIYINFWAQWCPPCLQELPALFELQAALAQYPIQFLFVNLDEPANFEKALEMATVYLDTGHFIFKQNESFTSLLKIEMLPYHIIIDKKGLVAAEFFGDILQQKEHLKTMLLDLLKESPASFVQK